MNNDKVEFDFNSFGTHKVLDLYAEAVSGSDQKISCDVDIGGTVVTLKLDLFFEPQGDFVITWLTVSNDQDLPDCYNMLDDDAKWNIVIDLQNNSFARQLSASPAAKKSHAEYIEECIDENCWN